MIGILRWLPISLALHLAALAATLLLPRERALLPLFVDLTLSPTPVQAPASESRSAARESVAAPRRQRAAARSSASPPAAPPRPATPDTVSPAPAPPPAAPEAPPASAAAVPAPMPAAAPEPDRRAESPVAPPQSTPPSVSSGTSATGASSFASPAAENGAAPSAAAGTIGGETGVTAGAREGEAGGVVARDGKGSRGETLALAIPGDDGGAYAGYISLLRRRVQQALTYPSTARRRGISGTVHLDITVEPSGRIADVQVVRSSSHEVLDEAALDAVRALRQVPFPPNLRPRPVRVRLPVVFELR